MIVSQIQKIKHFLLHQLGVNFYLRCQSLQNKAAAVAFVRAISSIGPESKIHHPFYLINPHCISVGSGFWAGPGLRLEAWDSFHGQQFTPKIVIGDSVSVNWNVHIGAIGRIEIGNHVLIGSHVLITDHSHGNLSLEEQDIPPAIRPLISKGPVIIEDNVWIGEGACILSGVHIGRSAVIGANAVVTRDIAPGEVVGGVPARRISHFLVEVPNAVPESETK